MDLLKTNVNQDVIDRAGELAGQFSTAQPFRHVLIDNFFTTDFCRQLTDNFPAFDETLAVNEDGVVGYKAVNEKIIQLGPCWQDLDGLVQDASFRGLISEITGIADLQYDPHYYGGGTHENLHGQGLAPHIDFNIHPITRQHRRLNLIVYLTEEWRDEWGGSIQLHRDPYVPPEHDQIVSITPRFNRCVIFETNEHSWHGFPRIDLPEDKRALSRRSFALYYYTESRPEAETGPEHSTIYVEQHLPGEFHSGMELSAEQLQHIRDLLASRDQHLKRLYEEIKRTNTGYNQLKAYHSEQQSELEFLRERTQQQELSLKELEQSLNECIKVYKSAMAAAKTEFERQESEITKLSSRLSEVLESTSWRITRPMRRIKRRIAKK